MVSEVVKARVVTGKRIRWPFDRRVRRFNKSGFTECGRVSLEYFRVCRKIDGYDAYGLELTVDG